MATVTTRRAQRQISDERARLSAAGLVTHEPKREPAFLRGGNAAAAALLARVQPKLQVGPAGDRYEHEADDIAARAVQALASPGAEQEGDEHERDEHVAGEAVQRSVPAPQLARRVQRKAPAAVGTAGGELDVGTEDAIQRARGGGARLALPVRREMEGAFGADFSSVRVHTGAASARLNDTIQA